MRRTAAVVVAAAPRRRFQGRNIFRTVAVHILTILTAEVWQLIMPLTLPLQPHHPPHCEDTAHYHNKLALPVVTKLYRVQLGSNFYANVQ